MESGKKKLLVVLAILFFMIIILILFKTNKDKKLANYKSFERLMEVAAEQYFGGVEVPTLMIGENKLYVSLEELIKNKYIAKTKYTNTCDGYVQVTNIGGINEYRGYLDCGKKYLTANYNKDIGKIRMTVLGDNVLNVVDERDLGDPLVVAEDEDGKDISGKVEWSSQEETNSQGVKKKIEIATVTDNKANTQVAKRTINIYPSQKQLETTVANEKISQEQWEQDVIPPLIAFNSNQKEVSFKVDAILKGIKYNEKNYGYGLTDNYPSEEITVLRTSPTINGNEPIYGDNQINTQLLAIANNGGGEIKITYQAIDKAGNKSEKIVRIIKVIREDKVKPIITVSVSNPYRVIVGDPFVCPKVTAIDDVDGDISNKVEAIIGQSCSDVREKIKKAGTYYLGYKVTDSSGNEAKESIQVIAEEDDDKNRPIIHLGEPLIFEHEAGTTFDETALKQAEKKDYVVNSKGNKIGIPSRDSSSNFNSLKPGEYKIQYSYIDDLGRKAKNQSRTIKVVDTTKPKLFYGVFGADKIFLKKGKNYFPSIEAFDSVDGEITPKIKVQIKKVNKCEESSNLFEEYEIAKINDLLNPYKNKNCELHLEYTVEDNQKNRSDVLTQVIEFSDNPTYKKVNIKPKEAKEEIQIEADNYVTKYIKEIQKSSDYQEDGAECLFPDGEACVVEIKSAFNVNKSENQTVEYVSVNNESETIQKLFVKVDSTPPQFSYVPKLSINAWLEQNGKSINLTLNNSNSVEFNEGDQLQIYIKNNQGDITTFQEQFKLYCYDKETSSDTNKLAIKSGSTEINILPTEEPYRIYEQKYTCQNGSELVSETTVQFIVDGEIPGRPKISPIEKTNSEYKFNLSHTDGFKENQGDLYLYSLDSENVRSEGKKLNENEEQGSKEGNYTITITENTNTINIVAMDRAKNYSDTYVIPLSGYKLSIDAYQVGGSNPNQSYTSNTVSDADAINIYLHYWEHGHGTKYPDAEYFMSVDGGEKKPVKLTVSEEYRYIRIEKTGTYYFYMKYNEKMYESNSFDVNLEGNNKEAIEEQSTEELPNENEVPLTKTLEIKHKIGSQIISRPNPISYGQEILIGEVVVNNYDYAKLQVSKDNGDWVDTKVNYYYSYLNKDGIYEKNSFKARYRVLDKNGNVLALSEEYTITINPPPQTVTVDHKISWYNGESNNYIKTDERASLSYESGKVCISDVKVDGKSIKGKTNLYLKVQKGIDSYVDSAIGWCYTSLQNTRLKYKLYKGNNLVGETENSFHLNLW